MANSTTIFIIPLMKDDLRRATVKNQYVVEEVLTHREVVAKLEEYRKESSHWDVDRFIDRFDVFYSILCHYYELKENQKTDAFKMAVKALSLLEAKLSLLFKRSDQLQSDEILKYSNLLKMVLYIAAQFVECFELDVMKSVEPVTAATKGRKKVTKKSAFNNLDWEDEKVKFLNQLHQLCVLPLKNLWKPPIVEEDLVNLINNCAFKLVENTDNTRSKLIKEAIVDLLGVSLKSFGYNLGLSLKIIQILQQFEHSISIMVDTVECFIKQYGCSNIVTEIIREIGRFNTKDMVRDTVGTRSLAQFLVDLSERCPNEIFPSISLLQAYLDGEAYAMRNCVLSIFAELVAKILSKEDMNTKSKELRDQLLDKLEDHIHDVHAFVRSKVLQLWQRLCAEHVIPLHRQKQLVKLIGGRLLDKSSQVRKNAILFMTAVLQENPFTAKLTLKELQTQFETEQTKLKEMTKDSQDEEPEAPQENNHIEAEDAASAEDNEILEDPANTSKESLDEPPNDVNNSNENKEQEAILDPTDLAKQKVLVQYLMDCMAFSSEIHQTIPTIASLLSSKISSDVLEAINFFVTAYEFGIEETVYGIRKMLVLIWNTEKTIKDGVVNAYKQLYLYPSTKGSRTSSEQIVFGLSNLLQGMTLGELTSMEELFSEFVKNKEITKQVFNTLWHVFSSDTAVGPGQSHAALILLGMAARADPEIIKQNMELLVEVGLGPRAENDFLFAKDVCVMLLKLSNSMKPSTDSAVPQYRLPQHHDIFIRLEDIIVKGFEKEDRFWAPFAQQAIKTIYRLAEHPDAIAESIITTLMQRLQSCNKEIEQCSSHLLSRFMSILGDVALAQLVHLDIFVFAELKRRTHLKEEKDKFKKRSKKRRSALGCVSSSQSSCSSENCIELGLVGAEADDFEADFITKVCETELLNEESFLGKLNPILTEICSNPVKYNDVGLRSASALALGKFMLINPTFCETNLALLITIMEKSSQPTIRANTVILVGDLAIRFPNMVEPWTSHLYGRLHDQSVVVRKNTLSVLTHLILNDLLKVKSQISDLALCIVDKEPCISKGAKTFFYELSKKGNSIYNILPDIMSHLSDPDCGTTEDNFQSVLGYLMKFVEKDRQLEVLVEKLCLRFNFTRVERQDRDLSYCLSLIPFNERCLKKLQENALCFAEKMRCDKIYEHFMTLLVTARKKEANVGPLLDELENLFDEFHLKGMSKENMEKAKTFANRLKKQPKATERKVRNKNKKPKRSNYASSDSEELESATKENRPVKSSVCARKRTPRTARKVSKIRPPVFSDSSSEEIL